MKKNKYRPTAERLSDWDSKTQIIYMCAKCGTSFGFYGEKEKFCHNCGLEQDWTNKAEYCSKEFADRYWGETDPYNQREMMDEEFNND